MRGWLLGGLLGLLAVGAGGCPNDTEPQDPDCGVGTVPVNGVCVVVDRDFGPPPSDFCGPNMDFDATTQKCVLKASACTQGLTVSADKSQCVKPGSGTLIGSVLTPARMWAFWKYSNGTSLQVLGNSYALTATVPDTQEMYMSGTGATAPGTGSSDPTKVDKFGLHNGGVLPVYWDANRLNPSDTPYAIDHVITVGEWKKCTVTYAAYMNPPRPDMKHYYRIVVDATDCPPDLIFEVWFNYFNGNYSTTRILGTPAGGLPNVFATLQDGSGHWERDIDPNVWTKSGVSLNGNTHNGQTGPGKVPDLTTFPDAQFTIAIFVHNNGQSNGNQGWCMPAVGMADSTGCGVPLVVGATVQATPTATPYLYLPGIVGYDSTPSFIGGADVNATVSNTIPLKLLQPY